MASPSLHSSRSVVTRITKILTIIVPVPLEFSSLVFTVM